MKRKKKNKLNAKENIQSLAGEYKDKCGWENTISAFMHRSMFGAMTRLQNTGKYFSISICFYIFLSFFIYFNLCNIKEKERKKI